MFTIHDVLTATAGQLIGAPNRSELTGVAIDSRAVRPGNLFVALTGQKHDGHDFIMQALSRGAGCVLAERAPAAEPWATSDWPGPPAILVGSTRQALVDLATYWRRRRNVLVVGVTGSVGKTSTKELIGDVLGRRFSVLRTPANLNTEIGVPMSLMELTPQHDVAVVEMGMYDVGDIRLLAQIAQPQIGVVTNVQHSHLERLGTIERIAQAKSELVTELPSDGLAILNADDDRTRAMADLSPCPTVFYGLRSDADVWADGIESHGLRGIEFNLHCANRSARAKMQLLGAQSVHAALAAVAVALRVGMSFDEAVGALRHVEGGVRILVCAGIRGSTILDDTYNANPASMLAALNLLSEMDGRRVAVLGDMLELGSYEDEGHRLVGQRAASTANWLLTVGPRARGIAAAARAAGMPPNAVDAFETLADARDRLAGGLRPGDFVLVKASRGVHLDELVSAIQVAA